MTTTAPAPSRYRCFLCDRTSRDAANFAILPSGYLTCKDCAAHDAALTEVPCTCGAHYFDGCVCGSTARGFHASPSTLGRGF